MPPFSPLRLAVIGGGAMGSALLRGLVQQALLPPLDIGLSEPDESKRLALAKELGIRSLPDNGAAAQAQILLLAIKPQLLPVVAQQVQPHLSDPPPLIVSILAGISIAQLTEAFPGCAIVRTMPNTPALVSAGITALAWGPTVTPDQQQQVTQIFTAVGSVITVPESQIDAVTALSGSGPGYFAVIIEGLIDGGVQAGLARPLATQLAIQTMLGTAQLLQQDNLHPAVLKDRVTSPAGTTIAGIQVLEAQGVRGALMQAVAAAHQRAQALGS